MEPKFRPTNAHAQQNPGHQPSSSSSTPYTYFAEQAIRVGFPSGNFGGGAHMREMYRGYSDMRGSIQREIEKERIREEIIAEEIARRRVLEAEVRRELLMERGRMGMQSEGYFPSFMPKNPKMPQPIGLEQRIAMSLEEKYLGGHRHFETGCFDMNPFQLLPEETKETTSSPTEDNKRHVIVLNKSVDSTLSGAKRKSPPPFAPHSNSPKKKQKEEWSCAVCQVSATNERGLNEHLQGKKHRAKEAALIAKKTGACIGLGVPPKKLTTTVNTSSLEKKSETKLETVKLAPVMKKSNTSDSNNTKKSDKFKFWCEMCEIGAYSEKVINNHKKGRKHLANLLRLHQNGGANGGTQKTHDVDEKSKAEKIKAEDLGNIDESVKQESHEENRSC